MKKIMFFIMSMLLLIPSVASASTLLEDPNDFQTVDVTGTTISITGYTGSNLDVTFPSQINGKTVTGIGDPSGALTFYQSPFTSIKIPDTVTRIYSGTFQGASQLTEVRIPSSVQSLDLYSFYRLTKLQDIYIYGENTQIPWDTNYAIHLGNGRYSFNLLQNPAFDGAQLSNPTVWGHTGSRAEALAVVLAYNFSSLETTPLTLSQNNAGDIVAQWYDLGDDYSYDLRLDGNLVSNSSGSSYTIPISQYGKTYTVSLSIRHNGTLYGSEASKDIFVVSPTPSGPGTGDSDTDTFLNIGFNKISSQLYVFVNRSIQAMLDIAPRNMSSVQDLWK